MRDTKLIKRSLFILNVYFFGFGISVEEENKNDEFQSNITGMESSKTFLVAICHQHLKLVTNIGVVLNDFIKSTKMEQSC